jgi:hypothetical protein
MAFNPYDLLISSHQIPSQFAYSNFAFGVHLQWFEQLAAGAARGRWWWWWLGGIHGEAAKHCSQVVH